MMSKSEIESMLVRNSIEWNKEETQDRAFIYVDDFIEELWIKLNTIDK